jgi:hypothetical protein
VVCGNAASMTSCVKTQLISCSPAWNPKILRSCVKAHWQFILREVGLSSLSCSTLSRPQ